MRVMLTIRVQFYLPASTADALLPLQLRTRTVVFPRQNSSLSPRKGRIRNLYSKVRGLYAEDRLILEDLISWYTFVITPLSGAYFKKHFLSLKTLKKLVKCLILSTKIVSPSNGGNAEDQSVVFFVSWITPGSATPQLPGSEINCINSFWLYQNTLRCIYYFLFELFFKFFYQFSQIANLWNQIKLRTSSFECTYPYMHEIVHDNPPLPNEGM